MLEVSNLSVIYESAEVHGLVRAVRDVSFSVSRGECVGLVGESGCGKSSVANAIVGLVPASGGDIRLAESRAGDDDGVRARRVQLVFQDPFGSLNPRMKLGNVLDEVLRVHGVVGDDRSHDERIRELFAMVELDPKLASRFPHELSGGQRQRFGIARALAVDPSLLIADEPVSALDVSVQVQILNLLRDIVTERNLACLFIAHDLAAVHYLCDRIVVMYLGKVVESGPCDAVFSRPAHPYTQSLLDAVPDIDRGLEGRCLTARVIEGEVPSALQQIPGCGFHPRCPRKETICESQDPGETRLGDAHVSRCHFAQPVGVEAD